MTAQTRIYVRDMTVQTCHVLRAALACMTCKIPSRNTAIHHGAPGRSLRPSLNWVFCRQQRGWGSVNRACVYIESTRVYRGLLTESLLPWYACVSLAGPTVTGELQSAPRDYACVAFLVLRLCAFLVHPDSVILLAPRFRSLLCEPHSCFYS